MSDDINLEEEQRMTMIARDVFRSEVRWMMYIVSGFFAIILGMLVYMDSNKEERFDKMSMKIDALTIAVAELNAVKDKVKDLNADVKGVKKDVGVIRLDIARLADRVSSIEKKTRLAKQ